MTTAYVPESLQTLCLSVLPDHLRPGGLPRPTVGPSRREAHLVAAIWALTSAPQSIEWQRACALGPGYAGDQALACYPFGQTDSALTMLPDDPDWAWAALIRPGAKPVNAAQPGASAARWTTYPLADAPCRRAEVRS